MNKNFKIIFITTILLVVSVYLNPFAYGDNVSAKLNKLTTKTLSGNTITIELLVKKCPSNYPYTNGFRWGTEVILPKTIITEINIYIDKKKIFIPLSAFFDLTNPREFFLEAIQNGFVIIINGGDAASSYQAELKFEKDLLKSKEVRNSEFPDRSWEKTIYSFNVEE